MKIKLYLLSGFETPHSKSQSILGGMVYVTKFWRVTYNGMGDLIKPLNVTKLDLLVGRNKWCPTFLWV